MTRRFRDGVGDSAGFTLLEILVALMISGLVVSSIFQVLQGSGRFVSMQSAREEVQQNARGALDLIAGDLRAVPPGAILEMERAQIRFLQPRAWGVLCNTLTPSSPAAWVIIPAGMVTVEEFLERPHRGIAVEQSTDPLVRTGVFRFVPAPLRQTAGDPCDAVQPTPSSDRVRVGFRSPGPPFVDGDSVPAGSPIMLYEEVRYDVAASGGGAAGTWIRRMAGYAASGPNMQPMAGPVPEGSGLAFTYLADDGAAPAAHPAAVRQIGIEVVTRSRAVERDGAGVRPRQVDTARTNVYLRNAP